MPMNQLDPLDRTFRTKQPEDSCIGTRLAHHSNATVILKQNDR